MALENLKITPFDFQGAQVRTVMKDGAPWFVAADVCRVLEILNTTDAIGRLDDDERTLVSNEGREINVVSEGGLYVLVLGSRKPEAKTFKRWVTHEVLPALRKTGTYTVPGRPDWVIPATYADALMLAANQAKALEAARPKVEFYDAVVADDSWLSFQRVADVLNRPGLGRNNLFKYLRDWEILTPANVPYRRYIEQGYFRLQETRTPVGVKTQPLVSQKGVDFILRQLAKHGDSANSPATPDRAQG